MPRDYQAAYERLLEQRKLKLWARPGPRPRKKFDAPGRAASGRQKIAN
jgi:hypothetical protein